MMSARDEFEQVLRQRAAYSAFFSTLSERANDPSASRRFAADTSATFFFRPRRAFAAWIISSAIRD